MKLFSRLFSEEYDGTHQSTPKGIAESAIAGAKIRRRVLSLIERLESETGETVIEGVDAKTAEWAIAFANERDALLIHPILEEALKKEPDADIIESSLQLCFPNPLAKKLLNNGWQRSVKQYQRKRNNADVLMLKAALLSTFIAYNIDIATSIYELNEEAPELTEEQLVSVKFEACLSG